MNTIIPIRRVYQRLLVRAVYRRRVHYRGLVIESASVAVSFSYRDLIVLFNVYVEEDWMVGGSDMYYEALKLLEQKVRSLKQPVLPGYFITVWPSSEHISVGALYKSEEAAAG